MLKPGTLVDRYGSRWGKFVLPPELHSRRAACRWAPIGFEVVRRLPVRKGLIAPWKNSAGFGIQYHLPAGAQDLVEAGYLRALE